MPELISLILKSFANGFLIGTAAALAAVLLQPSSLAAQVATENAAGLVLVLFSMGATFGMGSLATAMWLDVEDG